MASQGSTLSHPPQTGRIIKKGSPKIFFSNERTFLSWLSTAVWIGSLGSGIIGASKTRSVRDSIIIGMLMGLISVVISISMASHAARKFYLRNAALMKGSDGFAAGSRHFEDMIGPVLISIVLILLFLAAFGSTFVTVVKQIRGQ